LAQISTKSVSGWGFAPDPTGGAHSASQGPDPLAGKKGKEGEGRRREEEEGGKGKEGRGGCLLLNLSLVTPLIERVNSPHMTFPVIKSSPYRHVQCIGLLIVYHLLLLTFSASLFPV